MKKIGYLKMEYLKFSEIDKEKRKVFFKDICKFIESQNIYIDKYKYKYWNLSSDLPLNVVFKVKKDIIICKKQNKILGICFLKNSKHKKKIHLIYVTPKYRNQGIGSHLIEEACDILGTDKPIVAISNDSYLKMFRLVQRKEWKLTRAIAKVNYPKVLIIYYLNEPTKKR